MSYNKELLQTDIRKVNRKLIEQGIFLAYRDGITSCAPLGFSGDNIMLFGDEDHQRENGKTGRCSVVSLRNYVGNVELLITDTEGYFLFYGRYDINMGVDFIAQQYHRIFKQCKPFICSAIPQVSKFKDAKVSNRVKYSEGFEMLRTFQKSKLFMDSDVFLPAQ